MSGENKVTQVVKLNGAQYVKELGKIEAYGREVWQRVNKELQQAGSAFRDYTEFVKKNSGTVTTQLEAMGKAFAKNLGRGAVVGGAVGGASFIKRQLGEAVSTGLDFGKALSQLASRADLSQQKISQLRKQLTELGKTGASLDSLPGAVSELFGATGSIDSAMGLMNPIAKVAAMGNGDATDVAKFVKDRLKAEGKGMTGGNVNELLSALVLAQRGGDFKNMDDAMSAMGGVDGQILKRTGLSEREYAGVMAGATRTGIDRDTAVAGIQGLLRKSVDGFEKGSALGGLMGGVSLTKNGRFNVSALSTAAANMSKSGMDDSQLVKLFSSGGLAEKEAEGLVAILRHINDFRAGVKKVADDSKTLDQAFQETTDNLSDQLKKTRQEVIGGFDDLMSPLESIGKKLLSGKTGGIGGDLGNLGGAAKDHWGLIAASLGLTAAGGWATGKLGGMMGLGGTAGGVAKGMALSKAGVTPVYVVNAGEVGQAAQKDYFDGGLMGTAGPIAGKAGKVGGLLSRAGSLLLPLAAAAGGYELGKNFEGIERGVEDAVSGAFKSKPQGYTGAIPLPAFPGEQTVKVKIEVDTKDAGLLARPKIHDNARDPGQP